VKRVLIAAASPVARAGLETLLGKSASVVVVGAVTQSAALGAEIEASEPDVVLIELEPRTDLPPFLPALDRAHAPALVVLADDSELEWAAGALRAGVRAILPRDATGEEILAAVDAAAAGLVTLPAELVRALIPAELRPTPQLAAATSTQPLTPRELEVLGMLAEGLGNKIVAARLGISEHTVKTHVASILAKLDAGTRAEAVAIGARLGLIML
jgi:two-component system, NarL family, response regulator YdfI